MPFGILVVGIPLQHLDDGHAGVGDVGGQIVFRQGVHVILGVAAHGAGGAAALLDGVLFGDLAKVEHALVAAQGRHVDLAAGLLAHVDGALGGLVPGDAGSALPAVVGGHVFRPALGVAGNGVVVVAAHQVLDHVVGQQAHLHGLGDLHRAGAAHHDGLDLLAAQQRADARAAAVAEGGDDVAHGHQVFTGGADGGHVEFGAVFLGQGGVGFKGALAPDVGGVLDGDLVVFDLDVHGLVALAFHDHGVIAGILEGVGDMAAHVGVHDGIALAPAGEQGDVHTAGAGHAGGRQGADAEHALGVRAQGIGIHGHFVPDHFIADAHAADIGLILGQGIFLGDRAGGQVHARIVPAQPLMPFFTDIS